MAKTILIIPTEIEIKTGLHIGGSDQEFEIGGIDNPVIMKPCLDCGNQQQEPYIPGSSIK
jgi:CRISPR-associated protein Csm3